MTSLRFLSTENINALHDTTLEVLDKTGVCFESEVAQEFLREAGCIIEGSIVKIPESLVSRSLEKAPNSFDLYNLEGSESFSIGSDTVIYNPASSAVYFKDRRTRKIRHGTSEDVKQLVQVVDALDHIKAQSTALIASDVPEAVSDFHRLFISLKNSIKPIVTGAFRKDGVPDMIRLLEVIVGDTKTLAKKPVAIFDCCPVSPLVWSDLSCQNLIDCAESGIPSEIVPAPLMGATSPTTLNGTIVQTNVEVLSGIVLAQVVSPGAPIIYGGAPADFDMKYATARFGAIESMIVACASSEMGKHYGVPTHAYIGSSDSKIEDAQSGSESALGIILGALARINIISGPGMLAYLNCQSLEKLAIDNELCGSAYRLIRGLDLEDLEVVADLLSTVGPSGNYLGQKHTSKRFRDEHFMPSEIICRLTADSWLESGSKSMFDRASERVDQILKDHTPEAPDNLKELEKVYIQLRKERT